jgi:chitodextrinase
MAGGRGTLLRPVLATALLASAFAAAAAPARAAIPLPGLVAAYSFDAGSGNVVTDASGNDHTGSIVGATWVPGRYGTALSFDGAASYVDLGSLGTFYRTGFTLEAWVQKQSNLRNDVAVVGTWTGADGGPMIWVDHLASHYQLTLNGGLSNYLDSGRNPVAGQWQHLAASFDGTTARFYINGIEVASRAVAAGAGNSNSWKIGAYNSPAGGFFDGLIDDVRIYNRALGGSEIQSDMNQPVTIANAGAPTAPGNLVVTARTKTSLSVQWSPSTDDDGVAGYTIYRDGTQVATTTGTTFTLAGLTCSTDYQIGIEARDGAGNVSTRTVQTSSTSLCQPPSGLVASYTFDEGSGATVADATGGGHTGTIVGATWVAGRDGSGLSFDGTGARVDLPALGTFYQGGLTLEAWVMKRTDKKDAAVVGSWAGDGPMIWVDHIIGDYRLTAGGSFSGYLDSGHGPIPGKWQHLAATFDGTTARFYIDGTLAASRTISGGVGGSNTWRIGAYGASPTGFFDGLIDDVRIYNRPLSETEIAVDMNQPVIPPDASPPTTPTSLSATAATGSVTLSWTAAEDDVGVTRYRVYRSTSAGFTPSAATMIAQPSGTSYVDTGLVAGTYHYKVAAEDGAGNVGVPSSELAVSVLGDTTPPTVAITGPGAGAVVSGSVTIAATAADDQSVIGVQFRLDGQSLGAEDTDAPYSLTWDTRGALDGPHSLTAVARDSGGNSTVSAAVALTVSNGAVSPTGLRAAYGLDEGAGTLAGDSSPNGSTATLVGAGWTAAGQYGGAVSLNGTSGEVDPPLLGTFYKNAFTLEAWVYKQSAKKDVGILGSWVGSQGGGAMIWVDHLTGDYRLAVGSTFAGYLDSGRTPAVGRWQHVAATYDGSTARIYVDGVQAASAPFSGNVGNANTWRIGAYGSPATGFFDGLIDNVRIYDRALSASEVATDMTTRIQPERTPPTVASRTPADGTTGVSIGGSVTAAFSEPMRPSTITSSTFVLKDAAGNVVPATVSYNQSANIATLKPQSALSFATTYRAVLTAGGASDLAGNPLASDVGWSFATEASTPPVLIVTSASNPFGSYLGEILRNEGLNAFTTIDVGFVTPALLAQFDVVLLGGTTLTAGQVSSLSGWVNAGGNLIAMRPDKQLAGLLGLTDTGTTLANAYLKVDTTVPPGAGIVAQTIQYHGSADRYTLNGATAVATLYSNATTATVNPAVTLRTVGSSGGQAAAFTFDLGRSVVYTRQGNPAWAGQERDGVTGIRPDDMFYGAKTGDVQPDWIDTSKIAIPQADEQQRLLLNLITQTERDKLPLPHFWYLPRGNKAVVVLSGDDHAPTEAPGGTASNFDRFKALSPAGCVVADWQCVRSTSYVFPQNPMSDAQAAAYAAQGFEIALHPVVASCPTTVISQSALSAYFDNQLAAFRTTFPSLAAPVSSRTHCVYWPDWASNAKVELAHGIRMDANYYHYPSSWLANKPGFLNGGGFPMRFADLDGTPIDVYQENTAMVDETLQPFPATVDTLLDNAIGPTGYYGAFGVNIHTDFPAPQPDYEAIVASAQARGVPLISYKQLLDWTDGRNSSTISGLSWSAGTLTFSTSVGAGARGLQTMVPVQGPSGALTGVTCAGAPVSYAVQTIKGIQYAMFDAATATCRASYS